MGTGHLPRGVPRLWGKPWGGIYLLGLKPEASGFDFVGSGPRTRRSASPCLLFPVASWAPSVMLPCVLALNLPHSPRKKAAGGLEEDDLEGQCEQQESPVGPILLGVDESVGPRGPQSWQDRCNQWAWS